MTVADWLNLVGRVSVACYFLWATWFNLKSYSHHLSEFKRIAVPFGPLFFWLGAMLSFLGGVALLYPPTVVYGAVALALFTLSADLLFHRFWTYENPEEAVIHKFFMFEHIALIGAIAALAGPHL